MGTYIVVAILVIAIVFAVRGSMKHVRGEGACCGGGSLPKVKAQRIRQCVAVKRIVIEGMSCDNCRKRVENSLNELNQVSARVSRKDNTATVKLGEHVPDEALRGAIEKAGYKVSSIRDI